MPIEMPCIHCRTTHCLPDSAAGTMVQCPSCQTLQQAPLADVNPFASPASEVTIEPQADEKLLRMRRVARSRLRIPITTLRVALAITLVMIAGYGLAALFVSTRVLNEMDLPNGLATGQLELVIIWAITVLLLLLGLNGLYHAATLNNQAWAWIGLVISGLIGMMFNCWPFVIFVIWGGLVMSGASIRRAFER